MASSNNLNEIKKVALDFIAYNENCPSPFHSVSEITRQLDQAGFRRLSEKVVWANSLTPGGKYYVVRNQSGVVAFAIGEKFVPGNGATIVAAHTDSPCLRIKPISASTKSGYLSVGVETYGGLLAHTWLDRDLSIAGRVIVETKDGFQSKLLRIRRPILRVPNLAIHLQNAEERAALKLNKEQHLAAVLATVVRDQLVRGDSQSSEDGAAHHAVMIECIAKELDVDPSAIKDFELSLYDTQPGALGGIHEEFVFAPRLDNQVSCFAGLRSLIDSCESGLADETNVRMLACFDHEEIGSDAVAGAGSNLLHQVLTRLNGGDVEKLAVSISKSLLISADNAHAIHPNYPQKHESNHSPAMHKGFVIKHNTNQRYATNAITAFLFAKIAEEAGQKYQRFVIRQDMGCGSTIGPILATGLGMRTVDVGVAQLSMHSIREQCGADDLASAVKILVHVYQRFPSLDASVATED